MTLLLITAPSTEPISTADAKLHLRVDASDEDTLIDAMVSAARQQAEHELQRALMPQTWELVLDAFPACEIELPLPPVVSITSIKYLDTAGAEITIAGTEYSLDVGPVPPRVIPDTGVVWPSTQADTYNTVRVRFVAGYANAAAVPAAIKAWMLLQVGAMYRNRETFAAGVSVAELPGGFVMHLLDPYRTYI